MENQSRLEQMSTLDSESFFSYTREFTDIYFKPKTFERHNNGKFYRILGVKIAQKIVMGVVGRALRKKDEGKEADNYFIGNLNQDSLLRYEKGTRFNELFHVPFAALGFSQFAITLSQKQYALAVVGLIPGIVNLYLIMLQRYNRSRVYNLMDKIDAKNSITLLN